MTPTRAARLRRIRLRGRPPPGESSSSRIDGNAMNDAERFRLLYGPYVAPKCRVGDTLPCEYRGREVAVGGMTDGRVQWPRARGPGRRAPILCGDVIRAVRSESEIAVAHHWGVCTATVKK